MYLPGGWGCDGKWEQYPFYFHVRKMSKVPHIQGLYTLSLGEDMYDIVQGCVLMFAERWHVRPWSEIIHRIHGEIQTLAFHKQAVS